MFAEHGSHFRGRPVSSSVQVSRVPRGGRGSLPLSPRLRPAALSGVNCTSCVTPLRGLELVSVSVSPTLTCGVIKMSPLRGLACWDCRPDAACGGFADGWGVRACAAALTVGLIFCQLFHQGKSWKKKVGLIFWFLFHLWERNLKKFVF